MASVSDNENFTKQIISSYPLDGAIEWIMHNMEPEDVFSEDQLAIWADENGYIKEGSE
jgi:hypothetical protein